MVKIESTRTVTIPTHFKLGKPFYRQAVRYLYDDVNTRIAKQQTVSGGAIKKNAPSTIKRKLQYGLKPISLVGFGRIHGGRGSGHQRSDHYFVGKSAYTQKSTDKPAMLEKSHEAREAAQHLERRGYVDWWGISEPTRDKIYRFAETSMRHMIKSAVRRAGR